MTDETRNPWLWECCDCGATFNGHATASLIPSSLEEQREHPLCMRCWGWRFDAGLMALSGQSNGEPPESVLE